MIINFVHGHSSFVISAFISGTKGKQLEVLSELQVIVQISIFSIFMDSLSQVPVIDM